MTNVASIARGQPRTHLCMNLQDPFTLTVALDKHNEATGSLYLDDGNSHAHESGKFTKIEFSFKNNALSSKVGS